MSKGIVTLYDSTLREYEKDKSEEKELESYDAWKTHNDVNSKDSDRIFRIRKCAERPSSDDNISVNIASIFSITCK